MDCKGQRFESTVGKEKMQCFATTVTMVQPVKSKEKLCWAQSWSVARYWMSLPRQFQPMSLKFNVAHTQKLRWPSDPKSGGARGT